MQEPYMLLENAEPKPLADIWIGVRIARNCICNSIRVATDIVLPAKGISNSSGLLLDRKSFFLCPIFTLFSPCPIP
jgi:hypothetical protein